MDLLATVRSLRPNETVGVEFGKEPSLANLVWMSQKTFSSDEITTVTVTESEYANIGDTNGYVLEGNVYVKRISSRSNVPVYESNVITVTETEYSNVLFDQRGFVQDGNVYTKTTLVNVGPPLEGGNVVTWNEEMNVYTETPFTIPTTEECVSQWDSEVKVPTLMKKLRTKRNALLEKTDKYATIDFPHESEAAKQAWLEYRRALRDLPANTTDIDNPLWPIAPDAEFPELKARLQAIETQANAAIQILSDFGISGLMDPIDTSTWPTTKSATLAVLDARLRPIETGATGARAVLDLFGVENLPEFTVDDTSTIESRLTALETAGAAARQTLRAFGVDI